MKQQVFNPYLPLDEYVPDAEPHIFGDRVYIYGSHDRFNGHDFCVLDHITYSAPIDDLSDWRYEGVIFKRSDDPHNGKKGRSPLYAPDAIQGPDGKYYLYFPARDKDGIFRIGVAVSDDPAGPFTPEDNYIPGSYSIDPAVLVDDDGRAYMYNGGLWGGQLEMWQSGSFNPDEHRPEGDEPALGPIFAELDADMKHFKTEPKQLQILDENGKPLTAGDEDRRYFEGPWMHKFNGKYYLSYSTGTTHYLVYAEGDRPDGPFTYKGRIMEPVLGWTTHHSIVEYQGKWYLFYHDCELSNGINHRRCVKYTELTIHEDGTIDTIRPYEK